MNMGPRCAGGIGKGGGIGRASMSNKLKSLMVPTAAISKQTHLMTVKVEGRKCCQTSLLQGNASCFDRKSDIDQLQPR